LEQELPQVCRKDFYGLLPPLPEISALISRSIEGAIKRYSYPAKRLAPVPGKDRLADISSQAREGFYRLRFLY
jgi:hypothetical protein